MKDQPPVVKLHLLRKACEAHVKYLKEAADGKGIDRHLLGLKMIDPLNPFFQTEAYQKSSRWVLSTSQITSEYFDGYGWGEVVPDGFGIPYMIKKESLHFNIASQWQGSDKFTECIKEALDEMKSLFHQSSKL